jgi:hypothetical protein
MEEPFDEEKESEEQEEAGEITEEAKGLIYDLYKSGNTIPNLAQMFKLDKKTVSKIINEMKKKEKRELARVGRPPVINPVAYAVGKATSELASIIAKQTTEEVNEALDLGIELINKIRTSARARNMTPKEFLKTAIEFYEMWSPLIEKLRGTAFENMVKEVIKEELMKTASNIRDTLLKYPDAVKIELE